MKVELPNILDLIRQQEQADVLDKLSLFASDRSSGYGYPQGFDFDAQRLIADFKARESL